MLLPHRRTAPRKQSAAQNKNQSRRQPFSPVHPHHTPDSFLPKPLQGHPALLIPNHQPISCKTSHSHQIQLSTKHFPIHQREGRHPLTFSQSTNKRADTLPFANEGRLRHVFCETSHFRRIPSSLLHLLPSKRKLVEPNTCRSLPGPWHGRPPHCTIGNKSF